MRDMFPEARVDPTADIDRRYTTPETMALCMRLADVDGWDLDVAADAESHWARHWYCAPGDTSAWAYGVDGLQCPWWGRVWCNPPFSDVESWVERAWQAVNPCNATVAQLVAMLLPANRTEQPFWQRMVEPYRDRGMLGGGLPLDGNVELTSHFLPTRVRFGHPGNPKGHNVGSPPFGCVLLVWRRQ
jgi:hypothetical protein